MTLLFYYKAIYHPTGVGTAMPPASAPKKRKKKKAPKIHIDAAPDLSRIYDSDARKLIERDEELATRVQKKIQEKHHRMQEEEILVALAMGEDEFN